MRRGGIVGRWLAVFLVAGCGGDTVELTVRVEVPDSAPTVYLTGSLAELGPWDPAGLSMTGEGGVRTATVEVPRGELFEYKFTLGSWEREGVGPSGTVLPNFTVTPGSDTTVVEEITDFRRNLVEYMADPENAGILGRMVYWSGVESVFLEEDRHVGIWLPPGYDDDPSRRYPVLYMSDGQNLFDPRMANTGVDWGVDEALVAGVEAGTLRPAIVVGVWNTPRRVYEYSPWHDAPAYADFLTQELIPRVNQEFRTLTGPENTFVMGSSMGGLLSYYLVKERPEFFGGCGCVSSHFVLSPANLAAFGYGEGGDSIPFVVQDIQAGDAVPSGVRFFFDYGTEGLDAEYGPPHQAIREWLLAQGLQEGDDFLIREYPGAEHNEASWRARVGDQLAWLLGVRR